MTQRYIDPQNVHPNGVRYRRDVSMAIKRLEQDGQIVPLLVDEIFDHGYSWQVADPLLGTAIVYAARDLKWETVLCEDYCQKGEI